MPQFNDTIQLPKLSMTGEMTRFDPVMPGDFEQIFGATFDEIALDNPVLVQVSEIVGIPPKVTARMLNALSKTDNVDKMIGWTIRRADQNSIIGFAFFSNIYHTVRSAKLTIIIEPGSRGRGFSRDTVPVLVNYAFDKEQGLGLHRVWTTAPSTDARMISVFEGYGFNMDGTMRESFIVNDEFVDGKMYGLLESDNHGFSGDGLEL